MSYKSFLLLVAMLFPAFAGAYGQEEDGEAEVGFREPLFLSELDKDARAPQAVRVGGVVFVAAMSSPGESLEVQVKTIYMRLQSILGNYGLSMADVAQERIYLKQGVPLQKLSERREFVYGESTAPARTLVRVAGFEDEATLISIELIAVANPEAN